MRIRIDIDGKEGASLFSTTSDPHAPVSDDAGVDGGAGPGGGGSGDSSTDADRSSDTGPPPDWLLESVATAEAEGGNDDSAKDAPAEGEHNDGGSGPSD